MPAMKPKQQVSLPVKAEPVNGGDSYLLVDASGAILGALFGGNTAQYVARAINGRDFMIDALRRISATANGKLIPNIALDALKKADEI
jgi:hypothetical protein